MEWKRTVVHLIPNVSPLTNTMNVGQSRKERGTRTYFVGVTEDQTEACEDVGLRRKPDSWNCAICAICAKGF